MGEGRAVFTGLFFVLAQVVLFCYRGYSLLNDPNLSVLKGCLGYGLLIARGNLKAYYNRRCISFEHALRINTVTSMRKINNIPSILISEQLTIP